MRQEAEPEGPEEEGEGAAAAVDALTRAVGETPTFAHGAFSPEGVAHAAAFRPRPGDVFILTPPKTGTTWLQIAVPRAPHQRRAHRVRRHLPGGPVGPAGLGPRPEPGGRAGRQPPAVQVATSASPPSTAVRATCAWCVGWRTCSSPGGASCGRRTCRRCGSTIRRRSSPSTMSSSQRECGSGPPSQYYAEFFRARRLPSVLVLCYEGRERSGGGATAGGRGGGMPRRGP
ncbi:unnamed protein product [Prorocentrum cordatum]|uniref:Sulfotransferase n=1 Tax=Prorocentrum cordatum TaxID=2364126 RepID=A0ABN9UMS4_9DINO|nr:unnamed protein product [Polarella glacialis]